MALWLSIVFLIVGLACLVKGADMLVDGGSALAQRLKVPAMVIGLTVVAFGTSTPELVVSTMSAVQGSPTLGLGNILGSNIFNILIVLGITAAICPLRVNSSTTWVEVPLTLLAAIMILIMSWNGEFGAFKTDVINRPDGLILICFFIIFMAYTFNLAKTGNVESPEIKEMKLWKSILFIIIGLAGLVGGGELLVKGAVNIAHRWGVSERVIGLTIVAIGTSLPELVTSIMAARKGSVDLAIGNVIGSNLFNAFLILGITTTITPIAVNQDILFDILVNIGASLLLFLAIFVGRGRKVSRWEGILFVACYVAYSISLW
ncbi:MAG: calcium/sodium antiporter [Marinifilaceae bacterium]